MGLQSSDDSSTLVWKTSFRCEESRMSTVEFITALFYEVDEQLPVFSAKYPPGHAPGKGLQSLVGAPLPGDVRGRSGH